jgi:hypothetical protein
VYVPLAFSQASQLPRLVRARLQRAEPLHMYGMIARLGRWRIMGWVTDPGEVYA